MRKQTTINLSMQICKLIAAMFVVFIHFGFPGRLGMIIDCIARFAVPMFFAISGYFSYKINNKKIEKRIIYMLKLNIYAISFYLLLNIIEVKYIFNGSVYNYLHSVLNLTSIAKWIILNLEPIAGHLWYLTSILIVYIFLWIYTRFFDEKSINYKPLYMTGVFLIIIHILIGSNAAPAGIQISYIIYRNALFWGLPMFCLGMFINQYYKRIIKNFNLSSLKIILIIIFGLLFSLIEYIGIGKTEMPIGMIFTVIGILLIVIRHPNTELIKNKYILSIVNTIPLIIYIIHPSINWILLKLLKPEIYENMYLYPFVILATSVLFGILYTILIKLFKCLIEKIKICIIRG